MAISEPHYRALKTLAERGEVRRYPAVLEIGEANVYSDMDPRKLLQEINLINDEKLRRTVLERFNRLVNAGDSFELAKLIYVMLFATDDVHSIDAGGTDKALRMDLNQSIDLEKEFDLVINHGTAEHVFNIANVFRVMHDHCDVGGLLVHESPFTGWVDHGFYCLQPTLFYDVVTANNYDLRYIAVEQIDRNLLLEIECREHIHQLKRDGELPDNSMLYVAMRKTTDEPFMVPMQGIYAHTLSEEARLAWSELR